MAKFIVPATYPSHNGHDKEGKPIIEQLKYDNAGQVVDVPEKDAAHFDKKGWRRASQKQAEAKVEAPKAYADMSVAELKALLNEREIEAEGNKPDLIAALEADDETQK